MKSKLLVVLMATALLCIGTASQAAPEPSSGTSAPLDRSTLPIKEPTYPAITELDARNAKAPARFEVTPPAKAPNIVIVLIDDIGFGHSSAFGGPIYTPTLEKPAAQGLNITAFIPPHCAHQPEWRY
jgi:arylsulfatase